jgi:hypothetical protein
MPVERLYEVKPSTQAFRHPIGTGLQPDPLTKPSSSTTGGLDGTWWGLPSSGGKWLGHRDSGLPTT